MIPQNPSQLPPTRYHDYMNARVVRGLRSVSEPSRGRSYRLQRGGLLLLIVGSAVTIPLADVRGITLTGDRLLGLAALALTLLLTVSGRVRWTAIHTALALFVAVQIACSSLNAGAWPHGLRLVTIYLLGFGCFALTAAWVASRDAQWWAVRVWIGTGVAVGLLGAGAGCWANLARARVWGSGIVQEPTNQFSGGVLLFAGRATFAEWNLLCSFLLIPFALALWRWAGRADWDRRSWIGLGVLGAMVAGLVFGITRAAWLSMAALVAFWWWMQRPRLSRLAALAALIALAFLVQAAAIQASSASLVRDPLGRAAAIGPDMPPAPPEPPGWWTSSPLVSRVIEPVRKGYDWNMAGRGRISRVTIQSWRERPLVGHGAGSTNRLSVVLEDGTRITKLWNGNIGLFVLHDSGIVGLAALIVLIAVVARRGWWWAHSRPDAASASVATPLLAAGVALLFCYQFTHGLWIMYPYVYLGLLTTVLEPQSRQSPSGMEHDPA